MLARPIDRLDRHAFPRRVEHARANPFALRTDDTSDDTEARHGFEHQKPRECVIRCQRRAIWEVGADVSIHERADRTRRKATVMRA